MKNVEFFQILRQQNKRKIVDLWGYEAEAERFSQVMKLKPKQWDFRTTKPKLKQLRTYVWLLAIPACLQ